MDSNELIRKGLTVQEDIKNMDMYERVRYASDLYNRIHELPANFFNEGSVVALQRAASAWQVSALELKDATAKEFAARVAEKPYCKIGKTYEKGDPQLVDVRISNQFSAEVSYRWRSTVKVEFSKIVPDGFGGETGVGVVVRWKAVPEWLKETAKFVRGHFEKEATLENWVDVVMSTVEELYEHRRDVVSYCKMSSNTDDMGNPKMKYKSWKTKGRILSVTKEMPLVHIYHAKKEEQGSWDNCPGVHGSNGTYVENANPFWSLNIKIKRPSYDVPEPIKTNIDVHDYVTQSLMPKLGWGRITQDRLKQLNDILSGQEMELETHETSEAALNRTFLPIGFPDWDSYLDSLILPRLKG